MNKQPTQDDWDAADELASTRFEESHEFPWMATDSDREDWITDEVDSILKERGFEV